MSRDVLSTPLAANRHHLRLCVCSLFITLPSQRAPLKTHQQNARLGSFSPSERVSCPAGRRRLLFQLAGVVPSPLLLELLSCPLCARSLETLELELGDLEGGRGEADGLHDFPQVRTHHWLLILYKISLKCSVSAP